ncbi:hypothetical protein LEMLEM_LOCUS9856 [Lemmus lemmus]|jgi:hypothetical protein
MPGH